MEDTRFFADLPELREFHEVADRTRYADAPGDWHVVITDVRGSTAAIESGRYRDVNALGVASIVALRNAVADVELPYVFGGDGATLLAPRSRLAAIERALRGVRRLAREAFSMDLRASTVPVAQLRDSGYPVRVARFRVSAHVRLAMFAGSGFAEAERWVKSTDGAPFAVPDDGPAEADLEGFECRWQPVANRRGQIVSLLVAALPDAGADGTEVYRDVIRTVEGMTRDASAAPLTPDGLKLSGLSVQDYGTEARVRSGSASGPRYETSRRHARKQAMIGRVLIGVGKSAGGFDGALYKHELVENTDFRKFDETLRMVLDLSNAELAALRAYLERGRAQRRLAFGIHCSAHALVTCFVRSYAGDHVHFVDGANGGYALAAKELKAQLRARLDEPL